MQHKCHVLYGSNSSRLAPPAVVQHRTSSCPASSPSSAALSMSEDSRMFWNVLMSSPREPARGPWNCLLPAVRNMEAVQNEHNNMAFQQILLLFVPRDGRHQAQHKVSMNDARATNSITCARYTRSESSLALALALALLLHVQHASLAAGHARGSHSAAVVKKVRHATVHAAGTATLALVVAGVMFKCVNVMCAMHN